MASGPARKLENKKIKSAVISKVLPAVEGTCSLLSAKITFSKDEEISKKGFQEQWSKICEKRDQCDESIKNMKGVVFFFSSVAAKEKRAKQKRREGQGSQEAHVERYWPAISYWIALKSFNGAKVSTVPLHSAILRTGMEFITVKSLPAYKTGKEEQSASPLTITLKDHNNSFLKGKIEMSFEQSLEQLQEEILADDTVTCNGSENVVRLQLVSNDKITATLKSKVIPALESAGLEFDVYGKVATTATESEVQVTKSLASPLVVALHEVERAMTKLGYALYRGDIYQKVPASRFTYQYCCTVRKFLTILGSGESLMETIIVHLNKLTEIMADPECEFVKQLRIDFDLIEVKEGWCFCISKREFVFDKNQEKDVGKVSPRAFLPWNHLDEPNPVYFRQILENSLNDTEISHFCEYFPRLLNCGIKQHKERVLCLVGAPNSGKTSLFTPLTRIIPERYIAMITKQKAFNKSMVDKTTQIIFVDEAFANLLDPDDWKILTKGGLVASDRKYKQSTCTTIRCPMFITCQQELDFGKDHNAAMDVRLRKFFFKTLAGIERAPVQDVQKRLKDQAMECIVWASQRAVTPDDELPPPIPGTAPEGDMIDDVEKERIRNVVLDEISSNSEESDDQGQVQEPVQTQEEVEENTTYANRWKAALQRISQLRTELPKDSLKGRQLALLAASMDREMEEMKRAVEAQLEATRREWLACGMIRAEDAHLLTSARGPYHPKIRNSRDEYFANASRENEQRLEKEAKEYFKDKWIARKEEELLDLQMQKSNAANDNVSKSLQYMISVAADALKLKFQQIETPGLKKYVLEERKRLAIQMGWISKQQADQINCVWEPLPFPCAEDNDDDDDDDEDEMFITPMPSNTVIMSSHQESQESGFLSEESGFLIDRPFKRPAPESSSVKSHKKGKITSYFTPSQKA